MESTEKLWVGAAKGLAELEFHCFGAEGIVLAFWGSSDPSSVAAFTFLRVKEDYRDRNF